MIVGFPDTVPTRCACQRRWSCWTIFLRYYRQLHSSLFASTILACNLHASWKGCPLIIHSSIRWVRLEKKKPSFSSGKYRIPACSPFSTMVFVSFSLRAISALKGKESKIDALTFVRMDAVLVCFRKDLSFRWKQVVYLIASIRWFIPFLLLPSIRYLIIKMSLFRVVVVVAPFFHENIPQNPYL